MKVNIYAKCDDLCVLELIGDDGIVIKSHHGYVPDIISTDPDGLDLQIDLTTGQILNWHPPSRRKLRDFIRSVTKL